MKRILSALLLLLAGLTPAMPQSAPANLPYHTVYGRLGAVPGDTGPGQAIPFATLAAQIGSIVNTKSCGLKLDGVTDDTLALQACINRVIAAGGGGIEFSPSSSCAKTTAPIIIDRSAITVRYQKQIQFRGAGQGQSCISNTTSGAAVVSYLGNVASLESGLVLDNMRITGGNVVGSIGLQISKAAYALLNNASIEGMDYGIDATDVDQWEIHASQISFNKHGIRGNAAVSVTSANSWNFLNATIGNNSIYGIQITHANAFTFVGGTIQYNGTVSCSGTVTNCWGAKFIDSGDGYGTQYFGGMVFEGNGGTGDYVSSQSAGAFKANVTFNTVSWARTQSFGPTVGYGTNQIQISGAGTDANYKIVNSNFYGYAPYAASGARPAIAISNVNARIEIDPLTKFWSTTEAPSNISQLYTYREKLTAARDYYVRTDGNDACNGLTNAAGSSGACAFLTPQKAADVVSKSIDTAGNNVSIGLVGTFSTPMVFNGPIVGGGAVTVYTPSTAAIGVASTDAFVAKNGADVTLLGTNITISTATSGVCVYAYNKGSISLSGVIFGACAGGDMAAGASSGFYGPGHIFITGNCSVVGGASSLIHIVTVGSSVIISPSATITLTGTPAFSSFVLGITKGLFYATGATPFSGAATGPKFLIHNGGTAVALVAASAFPGSVAGQVHSGGVYNDQSTNEDSLLGVEKLLGLNFAAPATPAAGNTIGWFDSTAKRFCDKGDGGVVGCTFVAGQGPATATNDSATAGNLGEYITSVVTSGSPVSLTTGVTSNITSISLTAGDWDVTGVAAFALGATTNTTYLSSSISLTSATSDTSMDRLAIQNYGTGQVIGSAGGSSRITLPTTRISLAGTTTVYIVSNCGFTVSTAAVYGEIRARRAR